MLIILSIIFFFGICFAIFLQVKICSIIFSCSAFLLFLSVYFLCRRQGGKKVIFIFLLFFATIFYVQLYQKIFIPKLPHKFESKTLKLTGRIVSLIQYKKHYQTFIFTTNTINNKKYHFIFKLNQYQQKFNNNIFRKFSPGDTWQMYVRVKRPHSFNNPGSFNYAMYLSAAHISAVGYILNTNNNKFLGSCWYNNPILHFRAHLQDYINTNYGKNQHKNILSALLLGTHTDLSEINWQVLQKTGTYHFMAIAGLHIGFVAGIFFFLAFTFYRKFYRLTTIFPAQKFAAIISMIAAFSYALLAGFNLPTERAFIMLAIFTFTTLINRKILTRDIIAFAVIIVLLLNPLSIIDVGFWLSFGSVIFIAYGLHGAINKKTIYGKIWHFIRLQLIISVAIIPLTLWFFHGASLISPVANFIAIPWIGFIILPLILFGAIILPLSITLNKFFWLAAIKNFSYLWQILNYFAKQKYFYFTYALTNKIALLFLLLAVIILLLPKRFYGKYLGFIFILPILTEQPTMPPPNNFIFTTLDVGQGLSAVITTHRHVLLFDTGAKFSENFDIGGAVVIPFLQTRHISKIDMLIVSHKDNDHIGGAKTILKNVQVKKILTSTPDIFSDYNAMYCHSGQKWRWDGVTFEILSPDINTPYSGNNSSCVLKVSSGTNSVLLTGDIEKQVERKLVQTYHDKLAATVLQVPHHGSNTSSSFAFIRAVKPRYVIFSTGYLNRFHFPNKTIITKYKKINSKIINTAKTGYVEFKFYDCSKP